jgi:hypothetical protein
MGSERPPDPQEGKDRGDILSLEHRDLKESVDL